MNLAQLKLKQVLHDELLHWINQFGFVIQLRLEIEQSHMLFFEVCCM